MEVLRFYRYCVCAFRRTEQRVVTSVDYLWRARPHKAEATPRAAGTNPEWEVQEPKGACRVWFRNSKATWRCAPACRGWRRLPGRRRAAISCSSKPGGGRLILTGQLMALVSLMTERTVRSDTAMTGEIRLCGLVLPVGGVKEKILAAHRAGIERVLLRRATRRTTTTLHKRPANARVDLAGTGR
jgi:hypothetical protein